MNPIIALDLASVVAAFLVFHLASKTQKNFGTLLRPALVIFFSIGALALAMAILEIGEYIVPETSVSNIALHLFMFAVLVLIVLGLVKIGYRLPLKQGHGK